MRGLWLALSPNSNSFKVINPSILPVPVMRFVDFKLYFENVKVRV